MLNNPKRNIVILVIAALCAFIAYGLAMATALQQIHEASIILEKPEAVHMIKPAAKQADVTPQGAPASNTVNVPATPKPANTTPQTKPYEAAQGVVTEKPKCNTSYIDNMQREIDEIAALIEAKPHFAYETENGQRLQTLTATLNEYKKGCEL